MTVKFKYKGEEKEIAGIGNGPIDSLKKALNESLFDACIQDYSEHSLGKNSKAQAAAYVKMKRNDTGKTTYGVGVDNNITLASVKAVFSAINRLYD